MRLENSSKMASPRNDIDATPICRCRVLYLGSSVPHITKDGLQGIQEPLRELYPEQGALGAKGIDSWLSVWSNGILLENVDENHQKVTRFFPIDSLHYCAAVRYVLVPEKGSAPSARFLPLDSPFARSPNPSHPPLFAAILRRTTGIKVLECHAFICKREMASNALVRCCFHAYADHSYARHLAGNEGASRNNDGASVYGTMRQQGFSSSSITLNTSTEDLSVYNGDENHKVWSGPNNGLMMNPEEDLYANYSIRSLRSQRPRQQQTTQTPPPPPPPPPQQHNSNTLKENKKKEKKLKKKKHASREDIFSTNSLMRQPGMYRAQSMQTMYHPPIAAYGPTPVPPPHAMRFTPVPPPATPIVMVHHPPSAATLPHPRKIFHHHGQPQQLRRRNFEEPLYLPSGRAQSPVASFQPGHFPHEAYLMQHFATMDPKRQHQPPQHHQSQQNLNVTNDDEENFNTGIYRRKGHINERAFSYSIRQEHRSRSYGSLANLKFAPTPTTPHPHQNGAASSGEERKKEREIIQMMHDLDVAEGKGFRSPSAGPSGMVHHYGTNGRR